MIRSAFLWTILGLSGFSAGCWSYGYRPVEVTVTSRDTGLPVAGVPVRAYYLGMLVLNLPKAVEGVTDANGRVTFSLADCGAHLEVGETRYYAERPWIRNGIILPYKPGPNGDKPPPPYQVALAPVPPTPILERIQRRLAVHFSDAPRTLSSAVPPSMPSR